MFRTDVQSASITLPTPLTPGIQAYFTNGDPATGAAATVVDADWLNRIQEELITFLTASGIVPSKAVYNQVAQSIQSGALNYAPDTSGAANTITVALPVAPPAYSNGLTIVALIANTNTGATNINVNSLGSIPVHFKGSALNGQELQATQLSVFCYDGGAFQLLSNFSSPSTVFVGTTTSGSANAQTTSTTPSSYTLSVGNIITFEAGITNTGAVTLNAESTGAVTIKKVSSGGLVDLAAGDLTMGASYQVEYNGTFYQLLSSSLTPSAFFQVTNNLNEGVPATMRQNLGAFGKVNDIWITSSQTYTPSTKLIFAVVEEVGGGAGGNGNGPGGAGEYAYGVFSASALGSSVVCTLGSGGTANANGGTTSFGSLMTAAGGNISTQNAQMINGSASQGGAGGTGGTGGDFRRPGLSGGPCGYGRYNFILAFSGNGGDSPFGGGGIGGSGTNDSGHLFAINATGFGAGGGGDYANGGPGSNATPGLIHILEFCYN